VFISLLIALYSILAGVFVDSKCGNSEDELNHGVLVVGYGSLNSTADATDTNPPSDFWIGSYH